MQPAPPLSQAWDLTSYFPSFGGPEYRSFTAALRRDIDGALAKAGGADAAWPETFASWEELSARLAHLRSYLECLGSVRADDEAVQAEQAAAAVIEAQVGKLRSRLLRALRETDDAAFEREAGRPGLAEARFTLGRLRSEAGFQMAYDLEALNADLAVDGFRAWGRLYDVLTGKMTFEMRFPDGHRESVPMARRRALMTNPDREVRRAAFEDGNRAWAAAADTCAAALNSLAGTRLTLCARRGRGHFLDEPLHEAALSRESLDALFGAVRENAALGRRVLKLGAKIQGDAALAWYDLEAPRPLAEAPRLSWAEAVAMVQGAFGRGYPALGEYFRRFIAKRWIDSEERPNRRPGAFQTSSPVIGEERIFMTYAGTMQDVVTLAHEGGHAWHTHLLRDLRPCLRTYPMTLAETASTFAEQILIQGLLDDPELTPERRAVVVDLATNHIPSYLLNIPVRFLFESRFHEERKAGVVSPSRLCELMVDVEREIFGDALAEGSFDPYFWASKLHFFITDVSFYNFPYTFGFLLSQALFAAYRKEGASFLHRYEAFLRETGRATCEQAVRSTLGWDLRQPSFWSAAIAACEGPIGELERLATRKAAGRRG